MLTRYSHIIQKRKGAKDQIWLRSFLVVLHRPFRPQKARVLFASVCQFLLIVVEVAGVVAVVSKGEL